MLKGTYVWADGSKYIGYWIDNRISGTVIKYVMFVLKFVCRECIPGLMEENMMGNG